MKNCLSGWHLIVDALVFDSRWIQVPDYIRDALLELVKKLNMSLLGGPHLYEVALDENLLSTEEDEGGITGTLVISTSHISIHTWPLRGRFSLDVFSCRPFDHQEVLEFLKERFDVSHVEFTWLERTWPQVEPASTT